MSTLLTAPLISAETALAADANFLTWTGASDAADAKANYIFSDDAVDEVPPDKYVCISSVDFAISRIGDGSGYANFALSQMRFEMIFTEMLSLDSTNWSNAQRIAFKDAIMGFVESFVTQYEAAGMRLQSISSKAFDEQFRMHVMDPDTGKAGYQYGIVVLTSVEG